MSDTGVDIAGAAAGVYQSWRWGGVLFLAFVGLLSGVVTSLSPCVLPVLPVILASALTGRDGPATDPAGAGGAEPAPPPRPRRPRLVVAGLVLSFCGSVLLGSLLLSALGLPQDLLRTLGLVVLFVLGLGLVWPRLGEWLERPFARVGGRAPAGGRGAFVLGLSLGLLYVPCAGPVLAAIVVLGATHQIGVQAVLLTLAFGVGLGVPLLVIARGGQALGRRLAAHARRLRALGGAVMMLMAVAIGLHLTDPLSRSLPGYAEALQHAVAGSPFAQGQLRTVVSGGSPSALGGPSCSGAPGELADCGSAPEPVGITGWLNTPGGAPLSLAGLRGKVVLLDFWTYSCINCQRTLPHLEAWARTYRDAGLVVLGVHTPEFAFERDPANVTEQARALGVTYPVALDPDYATWSAYGNQAWPGDYLIDAGGTVRHIGSGEGDYAATEGLIRRLLTDARPGLALPAPTDVPDRTPTGQLITRETYLGYRHPLRVSGAPPVADREQRYPLPGALIPDTFGLGGPWTAGPEAVTSGGPDARLRLACRAEAVYLVLAGQGTVTVRAPGGPPRTVPVSGVPALYPLVTGASGEPMTLELDFSPGLRAYSFTFG